MKIIKRYITFLILALPLLSFSQKVENIHFEQVGKQIHIYYDLQGSDSYTIQVFCSANKGITCGEALEKVTGAVGESQKKGKAKLIVWDVLSEREKLTGEISFKIEAIRGENIEMIFVKGGTFNMGSNDGDDEKPIHKVTVNDFYIGKYEITQKQWLEVMGNNPSKNRSCDECPVERVSWIEVQEFIKKLNKKTGKSYRLPTEAEWEFAALGGNQSNGYTYSGSSKLRDIAWYNFNSRGQTHKVGAKATNELGIHDMSGNVWEWCNDWCEANYYSISPQNNPKGPSSGDFRVLRGGSWYTYAYSCRVANRYYYSPVSASYDLGFRLVR